MKTDDVTDRGMVVPSPLGWQSIPTRPRKAWHVGLAVFAAGFAVVLILNSITVPYYALSPGEALVANGPAGAVTVAGTHMGSGDVYLTTVALNDRVTLLNKLFAFTHPDTQLIKKQLVTGNATPAQYAQQNQQEMTDSQLFAKVAALRRLGYTVPEQGDGALVEQIAPNSPADGKFRVGDVIKQIDGKTVSIVTDATTDIRRHKAGDTVTIEVARPGSGSALTAIAVQPVACGSTNCPQNPQQPLVGISLVTDQQHFALPAMPKLAITTNDIGGPSAGLAFTLGAIDALTTHDLTGGHKVAVTGTIDPDGNVGPVGGVVQKTVAVERAGCEYFLVPPDEYADASAKAKGHHLTVVKVTSLDDALRFLQTIGGNMTGVPPTGSTG